MSVDQDKFIGGTEGNWFGNIKGIPGPTPRGTDRYQATGPNVGAFFPGVPIISTAFKKELGIPLEPSAPVYNMFNGIFQTLSEGSVHIANSNPETNPFIVSNSLSAEEDCSGMVNFFKIVKSMTTTEDGQFIGMELLYHTPEAFE